MEFTFEEMKSKLKQLIQREIEPELRLYMYGKEYMMILYEDRCSFQRCGCGDGSGEVFYQTLEELWHTVTVDEILLERDWKDITDWDCFEITAFLQEET